MATSLVARWRYANADVDWNARYDSIRATLLETFATTHSRALQETLYLMGTRVLETNDDVVEIRFSAPNRHHFLVDLEPFGMRNDGEVFIAADRPYGLIEATVTRDDAPEAGDAWLAVPAFA
jgi:urate oxidase